MPRRSSYETIWTPDEQLRMFQELEAAEAKAVAWLAKSPAAKSTIVAICKEHEGEGQDGRLFDWIGNTGTAMNQATFARKFIEANSIQEWTPLLTSSRLMPVTWDRVVQAMVDAGEKTKRAEDARRIVTRAYQATVKNMRMLARSYAAKHWLSRDNSSDKDDLYQEAMMAVGHAFAKYKLDKCRSQRFSTYVLPWLAHVTKRYGTDKRNTIRLSAHVEELLSRIRRARRDIFQANGGRKATDAEVADLVGTTPDAVAKATVYGMTLASFDKERRFPGLGNEDEHAYTLHDSFGRPADQEDRMGAAEVRVVLDGLMAKLTDRQAFVLRRRFGFDGEELTFGELCAMYGVSRQRIQQIELEAIRGLAREASRRRVSLRALLREVTA